VVPKLKIENSRNKVPSLNFKQLPLNDDVFDVGENVEANDQGDASCDASEASGVVSKEEKMKVRIPKMDLNLKNVSPQESLSS
jgi:hypothetical protein